MDRDGQPVIAYLGEDRMIYLHNPGKTLCEFPARIMNLGDQRVIYITEIPDKYDGRGATAPSGYVIDGLQEADAKEKGE
jgi:hypothetical protein